METFQHLFTEFDLDTLIKLALASALGGIIGLEREIKRKPVGLKTCIIIAVTTCLLTIVSIQSAEYYASMSANIRTDPMRLAAQVISGIGFIGTGVIMHRSNDVVSGITTAAMIWAAAGIGISIGAGFYTNVVIVTLFILFALKYSHLLTLFVHKNEKVVSIVIKVEMSDIHFLQAVLDTLKTKKCAVKGVNIKEQEKEHLLGISISARIASTGSTYNIYRDLKGLEGIHNIEVKYVVD